MSKQQAKKRILRYLIVIETDTDFKQELVDGLLLKIIPFAFKSQFPGRPNTIQVNKLKL